MGGKTKQAQRTKNNSRPSSSGRSAELLGSVPAFVGFAAHSDLGLVPMAPGFSTIDNLPDTFDASISSQYQLVLRKMSKKDPITKVKALQEFTELITQSDVEVVKALLPLWPKFYSNLANDTEHRVRESAQQAQSAIVTKAGKNVAPYLRQLAPVWIASQYDNYAPSASIAASSFKASFSANKIQEVLIYCQNEILEYISKNLIFHTASTLCSAKSYTPEEAENKYNRVVLCSLQTYAMYFKQTPVDNIRESESKHQAIMQSGKFWNFSKSKIGNIRAAWFEVLSIILSNAIFLLENNKQQTIMLPFQNMDDTEPLVLPHVWSCILQVQSVFDDWHTMVNFKKVINPKLLSVLKSGSNGNATTVYPHLLPLVSKLTEQNIGNHPIDEFHNEFFSTIKNWLVTSVDQSSSKANLSAVITAFYECLRYVVQQKSLQYKEESSEVTDEFCKNLLTEFVIDIIKWSLCTDNSSSKYIFPQVSKMMTYWAQNSNKSKLYSILSRHFWSNILIVIVETPINDGKNDDQKRSKKVVELIQNLYNSSPKHYENKVKFNLEESGSSADLLQKEKQPGFVLQTDLKELAIELARLYIDKINKESNTGYLVQLKLLCQMFGDIEFFTKVSFENKLDGIISTLIQWLENEKISSESISDILFDILLLLDEKERNVHINNLLIINNKKVQYWCLQHLLSYPLCIDPAIRTLLHQKHIHEMLLQIGRDVLSEQSKEKFNLLHKCFFQTDSGEILVHKTTVCEILKLMAQPLSNDSMADLLDTCGSFVAQFMHILSTDGFDKDIQNEIFLELFQFSINKTIDDNLSEDTLWEITTCWQDALSLNDVQMTDELLEKCVIIITKRIQNYDYITVSEINTVADMVARLITCSTESVKDDNERYAAIDSTINKLFGHSTTMISKVSESLLDFTLYLECLHGLMTVDKINDIKNISIIDLNNFYRCSLFKFMTIFKLTCNIRSGEQNGVNSEEADNSDEEELELTDDYFDSSENIIKQWSDRIYDEIIKSIQIASVGESLMENSYELAEEAEIFILTLSEKIKSLLKNTSNNFTDVIRMKLFENTKIDGSIWARSLLYLLSVNQYDDLENGPILLYEDATDFVIDHKSFLSYVNITQILLSKLLPKCLPIKQEIFEKQIDGLIKAVSVRNLISNFFSGNFNEIDDKKIIVYALNICDERIAKHQDFPKLLLYNTEITKEDPKNIMDVVEFMNILTKIIYTFPTQLQLKHWDFIRVALSSWVLTVSKSINDSKFSKVSIFIGAVFNLFSALSKFIGAEKTKSSSQMMIDVLDEWENVFSRDVNLVLLKSYFNLIGNTDNALHKSALLDVVSPCIEDLDYAVIFKACKTGFKISLDDLIKFGLENLSHNLHSVRVAAASIIYKITDYLVALDVENLEKHNEIEERNNQKVDSRGEWHLLHKFAPYLTKYGEAVDIYLEDFTYKLTEIMDLQEVDRDVSLSFLFLWNSIIVICSKAPAELRSIYASWISENEFEQTILHFLFRSMPIEILKNYDSKVMNNDMFKPMMWQQMKDRKMLTERYVCHIYAQMLRHLPAVVRKWWNAANPRQKTFVDKLTTNFVSHLICQEELRAIIDKKDKHENMQVTVHTSTREVIATYAIDEARMELVISLAPNHPLGSVKVESGKQIGGRLQSRVLVMQLTIFLTHQNGSILDGLSLWRKNLDKKFDGVEECYVCYSVIHQDTCQLPKLSCKTCRKKFHGPCLYKWFTTSSKSTCPICRNVF